MRCPKCMSRSRVIDSRRQGGRVYRRRQCKGCGGRFSTVEIDLQELNDRSRMLVDHVTAWQATFQRGPK